MGDENMNGAPGVTTEDLEKSLAQLEGMATEGDAPSRKEALLEKAKSGDLEKSERDELFQLLGGKAADEPEQTQTGDELVKGFADNEPLQKALDVSDFLKEQHDELVKSLHAVGDAIESSDNRRHEFNLVMANAVCDIGHLVKSMAEQFEGFMQAPVRGPKSKGATGGAAPRVLNKSFGDEPPAEETLSKGEILAAMQGMHQKSMTEGRGGRAACGEDLLMATAKYEQTNRVSPKLYGEVSSYVQERRGAAH